MAGSARRRDGPWVPALAAVAYCLAALGVLALLLALALPEAEREAVVDASEGQLPLLVVGGALALGGLAALVARLVGRHSEAVRRLTSETRLLVDADPDHQLAREGPSEVVALADVIDRLAERRRVAEREVAHEVAAAQAGLEQERNQLAALMGELAVAVVVCNAEGRILLYNAAARSLFDDDTTIGIGRDVFTVVDRELVHHALARVRTGLATSHTATAVHRGRALEVQVASVPGPADEPAGFVLLLQDLTDRMAAGLQRDATVRAMTEVARARLGTIRAAVESLVGYPEMSPQEAAQFVAIVDDESRRLGEQVAEWGVRNDDLLGSGWPLSDIAAGDLLTLLQDALRRGGTEVAVVPPQATLWLRVDSHAVVRSVVHLAERLLAPAPPPVLSLGPSGVHAQLELAWSGAPVAPERLARVLDEPLVASAAATVREVVARHDGEVWVGSEQGTSHLRLLVPLAPEPTAPGVRRQGRTQERTPTSGSRPEFYDFDLFTRRELSEDVEERLLTDLTCTVLDTETTGLDPHHGDEIVALGAVRVVNGRLLRQECFERLLDPGRDVSAASTAVHGLTRAMLAGKPRIESVLPEFARYAEHTVLVGHNVGFDLQFLRLLEERSGVVLDQPVLDTLLLDAVVHPDHEDHSLEAIAGRLGVPVTGRHSALGDALVTGEVFLRLLPLLAARGVRTLAAALAASQTTLHARLDRKMYGR